MTYPPYPLLSASRALQCARRDSRRSHKESAPRASRIWRCVATPAIQQMQSHRSIRSVAVDGNRVLKIRQLRLWAGTALLLIATACATDPRLGAQQVASPGTGAGPAVRNCSTPDTLIKALTVESMRRCSDNAQLAGNFNGWSQPCFCRKACRGVCPPARRLQDVGGVFQQRNCADIQCGFEVDSGARKSGLFEACHRFRRRTSGLARW
jgi:hypothetical protein